MEKKMFCVLPALAILVGIKPQFLAQSRPIRVRHTRNDRNLFVHGNIRRIEQMDRSHVNGNVQSYDSSEAEWYEDVVEYILPKSGRIGRTSIKVPTGEYCIRQQAVSEAIEVDGSTAADEVQDLENLGLEAAFVDAENVLIAKEEELKYAKDYLTNLLADADWQMKEFGDIDPKLSYLISKARKSVKFAEKGVDYAQYQMDKQIVGHEEEAFYSYSNEKQDLSHLSDEELQAMAQTDDRMVLAMCANELGERNIRKLALLKWKLAVIKASFPMSRTWKRNNVTKQYHKVYFNTHEKSGNVYENVSIRSMKDFLADADRFVAALNNPRLGDKLDASKIDPEMLVVAKIKWEIKGLEGKVADYQNDLVERRARRARWDDQQAMADKEEEEVGVFVADPNSQKPEWEQYIEWADKEEIVSNRRAKQSPCRMAGTVIGSAKAEKALDLWMLYKEDFTSSMIEEVENSESIIEVEEKETEIDDFDAWLLAIVER